VDVDSGWQRLCSVNDLQIQSKVGFLSSLTSWSLYISILMSVQCPCDVHDVMLAMLLVSNLLLNGNLVRFEP